MRFAIAALLASASIILSAVALSRVSQLSLPLPSALPILNIAIPLLAAIVWPLSQRVSAQLKQNTLRLLLPYLAGASNLAPFALLILSLVFAVPSDIQYCATDRHWLRMFERKDETSIRSIQNRLQCCGLNSLHDRAWPFPSRSSDARACERTQHYNRACGNLWRHEEVMAAGLTAFSSFLNWIVLVLLASGASPSRVRQVQPAWARSQHLIEGQTAQGASTQDPGDAETGIDNTQYQDSAVWREGIHSDNVPER